MNPRTNIYGMADYYSLLEVPYDATSETISKKFKKLAVKYHPDKTKDPKHHEIFIKINQAYETLKSPESKQKYDLSLGINSEEAKTPRTSDYTRRTGTQGTSYTSFSTYHMPHSSQSYAWSHFRSYFSTEELIQKQRQAQMEKIRRDVELRKAKEEAERQKEMLRQRDRERAMKREMENLRAYQEQQQQQQQQQQGPSTGTQESADAFESNLYNQRKKQTYQAQWSEPLKPFDNDIFSTNFASRSKSGDNQTDPVPVEVIEESESETDGRVENSSASDVFNGSGGGNGQDGFDGQGGFDRSAEPVAGKGAESDPIVVEDEGSQRPFSVESEEGDITEQSSSSLAKEPQTEESTSSNDSEHESQSTKSENIKSEKGTGYKNGSFKSTNRNTNQNTNANESRSRKTERDQNDLGTQPNKKPKRSSFFMDFESSLRPDIGQDDLDDIRYNLPEFDTKHNMNPTNNFNKRFKHAEFSDGSSRADTIHIPINKTFIKGHPVPTATDTTKQTMTKLDFNASPKVNEIHAPEPPSITIDKNILKSTWDNYVQQIQVYQEGFIEYRTQIIKYQAERASRDAELAQVYNSDYDVFKVYLSCLNQDSNVLARYAESTRQFNQAMKDYQQNCDWVKITSANTADMPNGNTSN